MHFALIQGIVVAAALLAATVRFLALPAKPAAARNRGKIPGKRTTLLVALLPLSLLLSVTARGQASMPDPQKQSLGSLTNTGDVFVNEAKAPSEVTLYAGDVVRTGDTGSSILTTSGGNSFEISHQSVVDFTGEARYSAELKAGSVSVKSVGGPAGTVLRAGNFVVVPTNRNERTVVTVTKMQDGSYLLTCTAGNTGVVPLQQGQGLFLQAGQSARISVQGELAAVETPPPGTAPAGKRSKTWIYVGLAGAGVAAGVAAAIATRQPVSPAAP
jgi:hypothetical protein